MMLVDNKHTHTHTGQQKTKLADRKFLFNHYNHFYILYYYIFVCLFSILDNYFFLFKLQNKEEKIDLNNVD